VGQRLARLAFYFRVSNRELTFLCPGSVRDQLLLYPVRLSILRFFVPSSDSLDLEQHSRTLLLDAVSNDVEFLSSNGNIDFSLLVGVDDEANTLVVGLIDTLGGEAKVSLVLLLKKC